DEEEIVEGVGVREDVDREQPEIERLAGEAAQSVISSGQRAPLEGDIVEDLAERDGDHGEVDAAPAHDERAQQGAGNAAEQHPAQERQRGARSEELEREARPVGAEPEIGGMPERQHAREAEQEIHRHCAEPEHQHARAECRIAADRRHPVGRQRQDCPDRRERREAARLVRAAHVIMPSSPSRPRGRIRSTTAMRTYITAPRAAGRNTAVTPDATPIRSPPSSVPARLPTPPTMMAMKLGIRSPVPIVGSRPSWPAASTPLRPARKMPTAKLSERSMRTLMPSAATVSRSSVP